MEQTLQIIEIVLAVILVVSILMQQRGSGLGGAFGSEFSAYHSRRGFERFLYYATIVLAVLFVGLAVVNLIVVAR